MPSFDEGSLTPDQVYALTAYILYKNDIIGQNEVMKEPIFHHCRNDAGPEILK